MGCCLSLAPGLESWRNAARGFLEARLSSETFIHFDGSYGGNAEDLDLHDAERRGIFFQTLLASGETSS